MQQIVDVFAAGFQRGDLLGIAEIGDVHLIDLQVLAAGGTEGSDGFVVGLAQIGEKSVQSRIRRRIDGVASATEVYDRGRRNGLFRHRPVHVRGDEFIILQHDRLAEADATVDTQRMPDRQAAFEQNLLLGNVEFDPIEAGDKVEVPVGAAVLAVGGGAQADLLLLRDR